MSFLMCLVSCVVFACRIGRVVEMPPRQGSLAAFWDANRRREDANRASERETAAVALSGDAPGSSGAEDASANRGPPADVVM